MTHRLMVAEQPDGRVAVALQRSGQIFPEAAGDAVQFDSPFGVAEREDIRWYLEDYLIAPFAVYEERGRNVEARLPEWDTDALVAHRPRTGQRERRTTPPIISTGAYKGALAAPGELYPAVSSRHLAFDYKREVRFGS